MYLADAMSEIDHEKHNLHATFMQALRHFTPVSAALCNDFSIVSQQLQHIFRVHHADPALSGRIEAVCEHCPDMQVPGTAKEDEAFLRRLFTEPLANQLTALHGHVEDIRDGALGTAQRIIATRLFAETAALTEVLAHFMTDLAESYSRVTHLLEPRDEQKDMQLSGAAVHFQSIRDKIGKCLGQLENILEQRSAPSHVPSM